MEFDTGKSDKDYSSMSVDDHHKINARDFFIPTKVFLISLLCIY